MSQTERRRYFRINDTIGLSYSLLDDAANDTANNAQDVGITAAHVLAKIDRELNGLINVMWRENPTTAKVLGLLNQKIEVLTDEIIGDERLVVEHQQRDTEVNISGCGIAFSGDERLPVGQKLRLNITLKPANTHLVINGEVVACEINADDSEHSFHLRINFTEEETAAQEALIQHIVQRQFSNKNK
ncbi:PilZ domain-containing protein [Porticoccus sp. W117]|uniref:PilZ domain-containing protein n=1 Tax=Porticoccus sp. W117 TaxID=3054777 RepID=UPI00259AD7C5|nr:PilZ domain-containing protein [Porticoccus sp. W117]MDM3871978.1 PilZ domain-containing protein [Porticoccus sp. W117]